MWIGELEGLFVSVKNVVVNVSKFHSQVNQLQGELAHMATKREESVSLKLVESNAKTEIQRSQYKAKAELDKKEIEIFKLIEGRKSLEDEISASKSMLANERERWQLEDERKTSAIKTLDLKLKVTVP